jgi:DNA-binding LacI/PurR family transcriptional regulator/AraC-like DNA-binding protein
MGNEDLIMSAYNKRLMIGIIMAKASDIEQRQILSGITNQAVALDMDITIFSNIFNSSEYNKNISKENNIYELIESDRIDGLILAAESITDPELQQYIFRKIMGRTDIPVIVTGAEIDGLTCINPDTSCDIEKITDHIIDVHKLTDIDFLTGSDNARISHERIKGFRNSLIKHNLHFDENNVIFGDFRISSGENLAEQYINHRRRIPQAVICANDYMAFGLCDRLIKNGFRIPEDITVTGYEYIEERVYHSPLLTTFQSNRKEIGALAVRMLYKKMTGIECTESDEYHGHMIMGNSCSCGVNNKELIEEISKIRKTMYYHKLNDTSVLEQPLTECRSVTEFVKVLSSHSYLLPEVSGLFICLCDDWCKSINFQNSQQIDRIMTLYGIIDIHSTVNAPVVFNKKSLFPDTALSENSPSILYCCPLFFGDDEFGYAVIRYEDSDKYSYNYFQWFRIVSNTLAFLKMKNDVNYLLQFQNLSSFYDSVTGLYSRQGAENMLNIMLGNAPSGQNFIMIMIRTGFANYNSGIKQNNLSDNLNITLEIADILKKLIQNKNELCGRFDENLFVFAGTGNYTENSERILSDRLQTLLRHSEMYQNTYGANSFICASMTKPTAKVDFNHEAEILMQNINKRTEKIIEKQAMPNYEQYARFRNDIYCNPRKLMPTNEVCCKFNLSYGHFRATYKSYFDISYHQDCIMSKISLAKYLLITTNMNISAIAEECGYDDDKYFMHQFRQMTLCTPNQYRIYNK